MALLMTVAINASLSGASLPISALFAGGDIPKAAALGGTHHQSFQGHHQGASLGQRDLEDTEYFRIMILCNHIFILIYVLVTLHPQGVTAHLWCGLNQ